MYRNSLESPGTPPSRYRHGTPSQISQKSPALQERGWEGSSPEHIVMAVYLWAHLGVVQDAPVAHHGAADAPGAPSREAGQEQLLPGHRGEAGHDLLHHCNEGTPFRALEGPGIQRHFSQGWWPPGKRRTRHKKHGPLLGPSAHPGHRGEDSQEKLSSMKPKGGAKCSRRPHSLWLKCLESRKRVRLGRKRFWSQGDLEALIFTESGQVYMQENGSGRERRRKAMAKGWGSGEAGAESRPQSWEGVGLCYLFHPIPRAFWPHPHPHHRSSQPTVVRRAPREPVVLSPQGKCTFLRVRGADQPVNVLRVPGLCVVAVMCVNTHALQAPFPRWAQAVFLREGREGGS